MAALARQVRGGRPCDYPRMFPESAEAFGDCVEIEFNEQHLCIACNKVFCSNHQYMTSECEVHHQKFCCLGNEPGECPQQGEFSWICEDDQRICTTCGIGGCFGHENELGRCRVCTDVVCVGTPLFGPQPDLWRENEYGVQETQNTRCSVRCVACEEVVCGFCNTQAASRILGHSRVIERCRYCRFMVCNRCQKHGRCGHCRQSPTDEPDFLPDTGLDDVPDEGDIIEIIADRDAQDHIEDTEDWDADYEGGFQLGPWD